MVKIVVVGGSRNLGRDIAEELIQQAKHDVTVFTRSEPHALAAAGIKSIQVDYTDIPKLIELLRGTHTVISTVVPSTDHGNIAQRNTIKACIAAGVCRFIPSEFGGSSNSGIEGYAGKSAIHSYLQELNKNEKVLEYTLILPGMFMDYLAAPYQTTKFSDTFKIHIDMESCRAIQLADGSQRMSWTTVQDIVKVIVLALDLPEGSWPEIGSMQGSNLTVKELIELGEEIRGRKFYVEKVLIEDLEKGELKTSWTPSIDHRSMPSKNRSSHVRKIVAESILGAEKGYFNTGRVWNDLLPDYNFTGVKYFLETVWGRKA